MPPRSWITKRAHEPSCVAENWDIASDKQYLFRSEEAFMKFVGGIRERKLANCYYFTKSQDFTNPEDEIIDQFVDHWQWRSLIECNTQYTEMLTRLFYANFEQEPFICTTYICGKLIHLSLENLAIWLNLPNSGTEVYVHKKWPSEPPAIGTEIDYRRWFNRDQPLRSLHVTFFPSIHRLAHMFINNMLTPKARVKTNLEFNGLFYLRHLICLDELELNIPYIIICHMKTSFMSNQHTLPYAHVIHRILDLNNIPIPGDLEIHPPLNMCEELTSVGWVKKGVNGVLHLVPNDLPVNSWIWAEHALPNQYWDPRAPQQDDAEAGSSVHVESTQPPPQGDNIAHNITWMTRQLGNMTTMMERMEHNQKLADEKCSKMTSQLNNMEVIQRGLLKRFNKHYPEEDEQEAD